MSGAIADEADFGGRVSCRTGPLRVGRSLRDVCTGQGDTIVLGPPVGWDCDEVTALLFL